MEEGGPGVSAGPLVRAGEDGLWCQPLSLCHSPVYTPPPAPGPTINLSLTTWGWVRCPRWGSVTITGCSYLLWGSLSWHAHPSPDLLSSLKGVFKHYIEPIASPWYYCCYAYCLRPIYSVQIFIFSRFAPIEITAWSRVMWTAISELLCCYWSRRRPGPGPSGDGETMGTTQHPLINWSRPGLRGAEKSEKTEQIKHQCLSSSQFFVSKHSNGRI